MFGTDQDEARLTGGPGCETGGEPLVERGSVRLPELMAPAGEREALVAAVQNGADAVYLGGRVFSARMYAPNFDDRELVWAIDYCHVRGVKVYCAVNTLLLAEELEGAVRFAGSVYEQGIDGVIVQDLGLARLLLDTVPGLKVHASTQMTLHSLQGVRAAQEMGVSRVILARELTLDEIARIRRGTRVELETFVHGALCICYSGQCLMSSLIGGRSGNRGACAQPCRMAYSLVEARSGREMPGPAEGQHLLSPRDLTMLPNLGDLISAGVDGFKIEGRMRRPEYVAVVVAAFRKALDRWAQGRREDLVTAEERMEVAQVFNRGFCPGYYYGNPGPDLMSFARPNNRGVFLGRVSGTRPGWLYVRIDKSGPVLREGDGIEAWVSRGGRAAGVVHEMTGDGGQPVREGRGGQAVWVRVEGAQGAQAARPGDRVFKTLDSGLMRKARATYTGAKESDYARVPVEVRARVAPGRPFELTLNDPDGNTVTVASSEPCPAAETSPATSEGLAQQLDRFGNTPFAPVRFGVTVSPSPAGEQPIAPASIVNRVRREAVEALVRARAEAARRAAPSPDTSSAPFAPAASESTRAGRAGRAGPAGPGETEPSGQEAPNVAGCGFPKLVACVGSWEAGQAAVDAGADEVCLCLEAMGGRGRASLERWARGVADLRAGSKTDDGPGCGGAGGGARRGVGSGVGGAGAEVSVGFPRVQNSDELEQDLAFLDALLGSGHVGGAMVGNLGMLKAVSGRARPPGTACDLGLNVFNPFAARVLGDLGARRVTASVELRLSQARDLVRDAAVAGVETELVVHGRLPMMVSEHCLFGGKGPGCRNDCPYRSLDRKPGAGGGAAGWIVAFLVDRVGARFPVVADSRCRTHILNSVDLCMIDHLEELLAGPRPAAVRVEARFQPAGYVGACVSAYRHALALIAAGDRESLGRYAGEARKRLEALSPGGITRGHYFRGVQVAPKDGTRAAPMMTEAGTYEWTTER